MITYPRGYGGYTLTQPQYDNLDQIFSDQLAKYRTNNFQIGVVGTGWYHGGESHLDTCGGAHEG